MKIDEAAVSLQVNKVQTGWVTANDSCCQVTCGNSALSGIYESNISGLTVLQLDTGLLSSCLPELTKMARKFTHISTLLQVSVFMGILFIEAPLLYCNSMFVLTEYFLFSFSVV